MFINSYCYRVFGLLIGLGFFFTGILGDRSTFAEDRIKGKLVVEDVLTLPGKRIHLKAFLFRDEQSGKRVGIGDENIEFIVQKRSIGKALTNIDGLASLEFVPRLRGNLTILAKVSASSRVLDQEATGLLAAWEKRRPILLVDMASLLPADTKIEDLQSVSNVNATQDPLPLLNSEAPHELEKLGKFYYNLVYLQRSNIGSVEVLRSWLRKHEFPMGVPMVIDSGRETLIQFLERLHKDGWENISGGIGRSVEFAEVLVERRIETVIIEETKTKTTFPRRAKIVKGWQKVRRHL